jgi:hypothetical protein
MPALAYGTAATMNPGTQLFKRKDVLIYING